MSIWCSTGLESDVQECLDYEPPVGYGNSQCKFDRGAANRCMENWDIIIELYADQACDEAESRFDELVNGPDCVAVHTDCPPEDDEYDT